nr:MAG TPA: hypothetical protein [Caudoviricetes sp.]
MRKRSCSCLRPSKRNSGKSTTDWKSWKNMQRSQGQALTACLIGRKSAEMSSSFRSRR